MQLHLQWHTLYCLRYWGYFLISLSCCTLWSHMILSIRLWSLICWLHSENLVDCSNRHSLMRHTELFIAHYSKQLMLQTSARLKCMTPQQFSTAHTGKYFQSVTTKCFFFRGSRVHNFVILNPPAHENLHLPEEPSNQSSASRAASGHQGKFQANGPSDFPVYLYRPLIIGGLLSCRHTHKPTPFTLS